MFAFLVAFRVLWSGCFNTTKENNRENKSLWSQCTWVVITWALLGWNCPSEPDTRHAAAPRRFERCALHCFFPGNQTSGNTATLHRETELFERQRIIREGGGRLGPELEILFLPAGIEVHQISLVQILCEVELHTRGCDNRSLIMHILFPALGIPKQTKHVQWPLLMM